MANYLTTDTELTSIADAIRTKGGTQADLTFPTGFVSAINAIPTGGGTVENAASLYAANTGNKYEITLRNDGTYSETSQGTPSNLYSYLASGNTFYGMVADSNGYVLWKGALMSISYDDSSLPGGYKYVLTGGGVMIQAYEYSEYTPGEPDPETGELGPDMEERVYCIQIDTNPYANTVYISTVAF